MEEPVGEFWGVPLSGYLRAVFAYLLLLSFVLVNVSCHGHRQSTRGLLQFFKNNDDHPQNPLSLTSTHKLTVPNWLPGRRSLRNTPFVFVKGAGANNFLSTLWQDTGFSSRTHASYEFLASEPHIQPQYLL